MPLALNVIGKKVLCSAEKSSVIWAEPHSRSSAKQFCRSERSVGHYITHAGNHFRTHFIKGRVLSKIANSVTNWTFNLYGWISKKYFWLGEWRLKFKLWIGPILCYLDKTLLVWKDTVWNYTPFVAYHQNFARFFKLSKSKKLTQFWAASPVATVQVKIGKCQACHIICDF